MAVSKSTIKSQYPLPAYNYRVTILPMALLGVPVPFVSTVISCSEVTGLSMEVDTVTYKHGFSFLTGAHIIPAQRKEVNLSIKKGVTTNSEYLSDWISKVYPIISPAPMSITRTRDILIDLCDEKGEALVRWTVFKALPVKLSAPSFDANANEVAFEEMNLIAHQLKVEYLSA